MSDLHFKNIGERGGPVDGTWDLCTGGWVISPKYLQDHLPWYSSHLHRLGC